MTMNFKEMYIEAMKRETIGDERRADIVRDIRAREERRSRPIRRPLLTAALAAGHDAVACPDPWPRVSWPT